MARKRSPSAPSISLESATERVEKVYANEGQHAAPQEAIAKHMDYSGLTGRSLGVIATLRAYGLLEGRGDLAVSAEAVTITTFKEEPSKAERVDALRRCAFRPFVFEGLREKYGDAESKLPSDATMRHWLIGRDFSTKAADEVIHVYRENLIFLNRQDGGYNGDEQPDDQGDDGGSGGDENPPKNQRRDMVPPLGGTRVRQDIFSLSEGTVTIEWPASLSPESLEDLTDWLDIVKRKIKRSVRTDEEPAGDEE